MTVPYSDRFEPTDYDEDLLIEGGNWNTDEAPLGAFSPPAETFGATALREILGHLGAKDKSEKIENIGYEVQQLLRARKDAEEMGEPDIAHALSLRLNKLVGFSQPGAEDIQIDEPDADPEIPWGEPTFAINQTESP